MPDKNDYDIGFKKPPKETQWKPGQSGNPNGRPKKPRDGETLLKNGLDKTVRIKNGGEIQIISKQELFITSIINDAIKGNGQARKLVFDWIMKQQTIEGFEPNAADREAFEEMMKSLPANKASTKESADE